jgi:undecaprenyl diphosphate synthase
VPRERDEREILLATHLQNRSVLSPPQEAGIHVAILMDGNGRWASARGWPRSEGHRAGVAVVRRVAQAAPQLGISILTLYALSADNWQRPADEVATLMGLFETFLREDADHCAALGIRVRVIGRRERLPASLIAAIDYAERRTARAENVTLRIAVDYSAREAIVRAACGTASSRTAVTQQEFARRLGEATHAGGPSPDVDLLIRTGGERRLSDFLLWECAYAELVFTPRMWPEFSGADLSAAVHEYEARDRRFGQIPEAAAG